MERRWKNKERKLIFTRT